MSCSPKPKSHLDNDFWDSLPILLRVFESHHHQKKARRRRFENFWALDTLCESIVLGACRYGSEADPTHRCMEKVRCCMEDLLVWSSNTFGNIQANIKRLQIKLKATTYAGAIRSIFEWPKKEEVLWRQRWRTDFLKLGDRNSSWFHQRVNVCPSVNHIIQLKDDNSNICTELSDLELIVVDYFRNLFSSKGTNHINQVIEKV